MASTVRTVRQEDVGKNIPIYAVWETTMMCNHACAHCGSRAGPEEARPKELTTEELLAVDPRGEKLSPNRLGFLVAKAQDMEEWVKSVMCRAHTELQAGGDVEGFKFVAKRSSRAMATQDIPQLGPSWRLPRGRST